MYTHSKFMYMLGNSLGDNWTTRASGLETLIVTLSHV